MRTWLLSLAVLAFGGAASAQDAPPPGDPARGKALYMSTGCWQCHGTTGAGGGWQGPKLAPDVLAWDGFAAQTRYPASKMPPYRAKVLSDADLASIHAYLRSIPKGRTADQIGLLKQ
jgi:ubiquinol-cytochrome c reductase cytochrome c subunit